MRGSSDEISLSAVNFAKAVVICSLLDQADLSLSRRSLPDRYV
jgi:hypothetical protein